MLILLSTIWPRPIRTLLYWSIGMVVLPFLTGFGPPQLVDRIYVPTQRVKVGAVQEMVAAHQLPAITAQAFLIYDLDADQLLLAQNIHESLAPASLTKLMTALLVLEQASMTATVTIEGSDLVGGASMGLQVGEILTVEQLLWGLLIPSGNDAAAALARHVGGSVGEFVEMMNRRAQALGLAETHFVNPHGLDATGHTSSAADLLTLTQQAWHFPRFRQIVATADTEISGHSVHNTNELLETVSHANGVKTGTTDIAGECLVAGFDQNGHQLFIVVLNSSQRYLDSQALYSYYQANYIWFDGQHSTLTALNRLYTPTDETWYLRAEGERAEWLVSLTDAARLRSFRRLHLPSTDQPWKAGMPVGVLEWWLDDQLVGAQPLVLW